MQAAAAFGNGIIDCQDSAGETRLYSVNIPRLESSGLFAILLPRQFDAEPDLEKRDRADETGVPLLRGLPSGHAGIAPRRLPQLGHHVGIEKEQSSVLQNSRPRLLGEGRNFQVDGPRFLISEQLEQGFLGPPGSRSKTQPFADQIGNPPGQRKIRIDRPMPRLAAEGVIQLDSHIHNCTIARLHGHCQALPCLDHPLLAAVFDRRYKRSIWKKAWAVRSVSAATFSGDSARNPAIFSAVSFTWAGSHVSPRKGTGARYGQSVSTM